MFITINDYLYVFSCENYSDYKYLRFKIEDTYYRINKNDFTDFIEYVDLGKIYTNKLDCNDLINKIIEFIELINNSDQDYYVFYYSYIFSLLINTYKENPMKYYAFKSSVLKYLKLIKVKNNHYFYLHYFLHYFKVLIKKININNEELYYTVKDIIFDFYS